MGDQHAAQKEEYGDGEVAAGASGKPVNRVIRTVGMEDDDKDGCCVSYQVKVVGSSVPEIRVEGVLSGEPFSGEGESLG